MCGIEIWPPYLVAQSSNRLRELKETVDRISSLKDEAYDDVLAGLAYLLVVRCSGHLEVVSSNCFISYMSRHSKDVVSSYIENSYKDWQKANLENLKKLLSHVSDDVSKSFVEFLENHGSTDSKSELGSLIKERGLISHGKNSSVTFRKALDYYDLSVCISDWFIECFRPDGLADKIATSDTEGGGSLSPPLSQFRFPL